MNIQLGYCFDGYFMSRVESARRQRQRRAFQYSTYEFSIASQLMWYQDSFLLDPTDRRSMDSRGDRHMLTIRNIQSSDFGNYRYADSYLVLREVFRYEIDEKFNIDDKLLAAVAMMTTTVMQRESIQSN